MGYGVPAGVFAKLYHPDRIVVTMAGDGDFLMNGQAFSTAVHHRLPLIVAVVDNGIYGTIRMHQERTFPGRVAATTLTSPDFAALARAFSAPGHTVQTPDAFAPAFARPPLTARPATRPCKIDKPAQSL